MIISFETMWILRVTVASRRRSLVGACGLRRALTALGALRRERGGRRAPRDRRRSTRHGSGVRYARTEIQPRNAR